MSNPNPLSRAWGALARLAPALALAAGLLGGLGEGTSASELTGGLAAGLAPRTDGTTVVFQTSAAPGDSDIAGVALADRTQFPVAIGDSQAMLPDIDGGVAVWQQTTGNGGFDIRAKRLDGTGQPFAVAASDRNEVYPAISGDFVAYVSAPQSYAPDAIQTLQVRNIATMADPVTLDQAPVGDGSGGFLRPVIDGQRLAWVRLTQIGPHVVHWQLQTQLLGDAAPTTVAEKDLDIGGPMGALSTPGYDLSGTTLVYSADLRLTAVDLVTGARSELAAPEGNDFRPAQNPTIDGRYVFWQDYRASGEPANLVSQLQHGTLTADLTGYDLLTGSEFPVVVADGYNTAPAARGGILVYEHEPASGSGAPEVYALRVSQALPSTARPDNGDPNRSYYPATGHALAGAFREFWQQSGGLPVFGYPLTEVFNERGFVVQYLERQRFEAHPEFDGTPYMVELGLLGVENARQRGIAAGAPFQPVAASSDASCSTFAATGHRLCNGFRAYWQSHGLDFGDPGISGRESLALFGYPISEEFVDPITGLVTQYFERAVFEYHPNNPAPYQVLLARLGADVLAQRGW